MKGKVKWDESKLRFDICSLTSKIAMMHPDTIREVKNDLKSLGNLIDIQLQDIGE